MENVARVQFRPLIESSEETNSERNPKNMVLSKVLTLLRALFTQPDLDYATFERLESKRSPHEMRRNGLY